MQEEIKEILEDVKRHLDYVNATGLKSTRDNEMKAMYDYITNLQENYERIYNENCKLREEHNITDISLLDENNRLKEENIKLKELCDKYEEEHKTAFKLWKQEIEKIPTYEEKIELVDRINKATEYIKEKAIKNCWIDQYEANDLLNILNGSDKE